MAASADGSAGAAAAATSGANTQSPITHPRVLASPSVWQCLYDALRLNPKEFAEGMLFAGARMHGMSEADRKAMGRRREADDGDDKHHADATAANDALAHAVRAADPDVIIAGTNDVRAQVVMAAAWSSGLKPDASADAAVDDAADVAFEAAVVEQAAPPLAIVGHGGHWEEADADLPVFTQSF